MADRCVKCFAPLTSEEKFFFYCNCEQCEMDTAVVMDENHRFIKSPVFILRLILFYLRRFWFRYLQHQRQR